MTSDERRAVRRKRRRQSPVSKALWIGFVFLIGGSSLALFLFSFAWEDSQLSEAAPAHIEPLDALPRAGLSASDFSAPAYKNASPSVHQRVDPADQRALKSLESKFGLENSQWVPLHDSGGARYAPPLVPTQSAKPGP